MPKECNAKGFFVLFCFFQSVNPYLQGKRLDNVVAKKSVPHFSEEEKESE